MREIRWSHLTPIASFYVEAVLVIFPITALRYSHRNNLRKERFTLVRFQVTSNMAKCSRQQDCEPAGCNTYAYTYTRPTLRLKNPLSIWAYKGPFPFSMLLSLILGPLERFFTWEFPGFKDKCISWLKVLKQNSVGTI